jgi:phospholipid N-methyltransferase
MRHHREDRASENAIVEPSVLTTPTSARLETLPGRLADDLLPPFASWGAAAGAVVARMQNVRDKMAAGLVEASPFLSAFLADPRRVSAVAPSGRALAKAITAEISPHSAPVIELGPGTGTFTRRLIERGIPEDQLVLIESGNDFAQLLQALYPEARVLRMDAANLRHIALFDGEQAGAAVSGLPLLSMSTRQMIAVLNGAFRHLRPGGAFYQFTYGPRCPVPRAILERLGLQAVRIGRAIVNVPPAGVYRITRQPALATAM